MSYYTILNLNAKAQEPSFLFALHEASYFDLDAFHELLNAIDTPPLDVSDISIVEGIYQETLNHLSYHLDSDDLYNISNLTIDEAQKIYNMIQNRLSAL